MIQPNTVITGDSLTILRNMEPESVDMVITDPPYGIDYQSGRKEKDRRLAKISNDKAPFIWWIYDAARVLKSRGGVKRGDPMKASGNGTPQTCVQNLLKTTRGEVPYERIKGIDRSLIDQPSETAASELAAEVEFVVETYEPRVKLTDVELVALAAEVGGFEINASIDNTNT